MTKTSMLERLLRRDRWILMGCLLALIVLSWVYLITGAGMDMSMAGMAMAPTAWSPATALLMFAMWWIMMIAMMVPSAAPVVLLFTAIERKKTDAGGVPVAANAFLFGYLAVWAIFSLVATVLQWGFDRAGLMAMDMRTNSHLLSGSILAAAGLYQFTRIKTACLRQCQSPLLFLGTHWRPGGMGALFMGAQHGLYCLGCCWVLMILLFVGGVMNLLWIAGLAIFVAVEKLVIANGVWLSRTAGIALTSTGLLMLAGLI